ncbi:SHOCT domain-containing protein [Bifidobacterium moukalabense]|uniref:SHOCT domain-containing protein n=1 Tax=Bifidobacterium moukalabense TaxID=1333651 RepID=UPI0010F47D0F|nr:SPFH domain-containing protein [Bifidobacterium moukalabense]
MAFIKAFSGALSGSFADQWFDFLTLPDGLSPTVALCKAVHSSANHAHSSNTKASECVITNGSLILVPEGYALVTLENGLVTGYIDEPGGYVWHSDNPQSKSFFAESTARESFLAQTWNRFMFGGIPGVSQIAVYVNMKEIPNNRFGTANSVYWDDSYLRTQVGASARGSYTLHITDPILFLKRFVPASYYSFNPSTAAFDFADINNEAATQLFNEVVASLSTAFSTYANSEQTGGRITRLQGDATGFANALSKAVEDNYQWKKDRGLQIVKAALIAIDYDAPTKELLAKVQRADALQGSRSLSNLQASFAQGIQSAGDNPDGGAEGMAFMGMAANGMSPSITSLSQLGFTGQTSIESDPFEQLEKFKSLFDKGVISHEEFDAVKKRILGI